MRKKIGWIGVGKLGMDCAEVMAKKHDVWGYDVVPRTSDMVKVVGIEDLVTNAHSARRRIRWFCAQQSYGAQRLWPYSSI